MAISRERPNVIQLVADDKLQAFGEYPINFDLYFYRLTTDHLKDEWYQGCTPEQRRAAIAFSAENGHFLHLILQQKVFDPVESRSSILSFAKSIFDRNAPKPVKKYMSQFTLSELLRENQGDWAKIKLFITTQAQTLIANKKLFVTAESYFLHESSRMIGWVLEQFAGEDQSLVKLLTSPRQNGNTPLHDAFATLNLTKLDVLLTPILERICKLSQQDQIMVLTARNQEKHTPLHLLAMHAPEYFKVLQKQIQPVVLQKMIEDLNGDQPTPFQVNYRLDKIHLPFLRAYWQSAAPTLGLKIRKEACEDMLYHLPKLPVGMQQSEVAEFIREIWVNRDSVLLSQGRALHVEKMLRRSDLFLGALEAFGPVNSLIFLTTRLTDVRDDSVLIFRVGKMYTSSAMKAIFELLSPEITYLLYTRLAGTYGAQRLRDNLGAEVYSHLTELIKPYYCLIPLLNINNFLLSRYPTEGVSPRYQKYLDDFAACLLALETGQALPGLPQDEELTNSNAWYSRLYTSNSDYFKLREKLSQEQSYEKVALRFFFKRYLPQAGFIEKMIFHDYYLNPSLSANPEKVFERIAQTLENLRALRAQQHPSTASTHSYLQTTLSTVDQGTGVLALAVQPAAMSDAPPSYEETMRTLASTRTNLMTQQAAHFMPVYLTDGSFDYQAATSSTSPQMDFPMSSTSQIPGQYPAQAMVWSYVVVPTSVAVDSHMAGSFANDASHQPAFVPVGSAYAPNVFGLFSNQQLGQNVISSAPMATNPLPPPPYPGKS